MKIPAKKLKQNDVAKSEIIGILSSMFPRFSRKMSPLRGILQSVWSAIVLVYINIHHPWECHHLKYVTILGGNFEQ